MGLNETPSGERVRIGFFGVRNAGKSSLVNAVCGQQVALVSDVAGTTTDPVRKAMELLPLGPVDIVDTPGIDDVGELGARRVERTRETLRTCSRSSGCPSSWCAIRPTFCRGKGLLRVRAVLPGEPHRAPPTFPSPRLSPPPTPAPLPPQLAQKFLPARARARA